MAAFRKTTRSKISARSKRFHPGLRALLAAVVDARAFCVGFHGATPYEKHGVDA